MAHNLATNEKTGEKAFFGIEPAWHGLGVTLDKPATAQEAILHAGLDYEVLQKPVVFNSGTEETPIFTEVAGKKVNYRSDNMKPLGVVGNAYTPLQNKDCFGFFDALVDESEAIYHTAGAIGDGEKVWILAKMPSHIKVGKDDIIEQYVLMHNSHDGSSGIIACITPVRVVCQNTLTAALSTTKNKISIRHTTNAQVNLHQAHTILGLTDLYAQEMEEIFGGMAKKQIKEKELEFFLNELYPTKLENETRTMAVKIREQLMESFESGVGQDLETTKGTVFGLYNAVTYWTDHVKEFKDETSKMKSVMWGGASNIRQKAFDICLEMMN
jgi:phage/plasmid-like protein (TIGR03299 family)